MADLDLLKAFRAAVLAKIRRDLAEEEREAVSLREHLLPKLRRVVTTARARGLAKRVWLFGSFVWGKPTGRSDVDLLVEDCNDPFGLAAEVMAGCERDAHVVELERAPASLRERVLREGLPL